ncbi:hypothetical protein BE04_04565 [Sorangium cellulosum]|uniref:Uncharacterized protein n=1 Tax=Sorangium cellulosum TaxID=56 RepID=A0A150PZ06_SORCE|nr:hypothetical protein BE04_04565 [Sorangium cellulosum]
MFTVLALGKGDDAEDLRGQVDADGALKGYCASTTDPPLCAELSDTVDVQYAFINAAIYSFIVGAAGVGTVVYALVDRPGPSASRMQIVPRVGAGSAGLSLTGRF